MGLFHLSELSAALGRGGRPYLEFLRVPTLLVFFAPPEGSSAGVRP